MVFNRLFEDRSVSYQTVFESGDDLQFGNLSATYVTDDNVFQVNAVFSAVSLIADTIATLPLDAYRRRNGTRLPLRPKPAWVAQPDVDLPRVAFYNSLIVSLLLDGNAFVRVFSNSSGQISNLSVLNPRSVKIERSGVGRLTFQVEGSPRPLTSEEIVFIPDLVRPGDVRGVSRVSQLKENFGLAVALQNYAAQFFGTGTNMAGVIEFPGNLSAEQASELARGFDNRHKGWKRGHKTGVLTGGATFKTTQVDPEKSQAIEARRLAVEDVARIFNVPPHLLGLPGTNSYASVEQNNLAWVTHGLRPIIQKLEDGFSPLLARSPGGAEAFLKFNIDGLLRADIQSRMAAYSTGLQSGFLTINDVRRLEDLPPMEDESANVVRVPLANVDLTESHVAAQRERVMMAQALVYAGFDPSGVLSALDLPEIDHTGLPSSQLQSVAQNAQVELDGGDVEGQYKDEV